MIKFEDILRIVKRCNIELWDNKCNFLCAYYMDDERLKYYNNYLVEEMTTDYGGNLVIYINKGE